MCQLTLDAATDAGGCSRGAGTQSNWLVHFVQAVTGTGSIIHLSWVHQYVVKSLLHCVQALAETGSIMNLS